ncbi:NEK3 [Symbiodinium microadriaticum]|nr:NEK3 [Symbiodinium microadriaticum]
MCGQFDDAGMENPRHNQALVLWLHGLQSSGCHMKKMLIGTRSLQTLSWVKWRFPESEIAELSILPGQRMKSWFDLPEQPAVEGRCHAGMQEAVDRVHALLHKAMEQGFAADRIVLCGFSQGGTLALQAGLSFPHMLAGICAVASWVTADLPAVDGKSELPILMCHGDEDTMVPIAVARRSCKSLASKGYSKVNLVTVKGLRHQLIAAELEEIFEFLRQVLPQGARGAGEFLDASESPDAFPSMEPTGCLVWLHDASLVGRVDETLVAKRMSDFLPGVNVLLRQLEGKDKVKDGAFLLAEVNSLLQEAKMAGFAAEKTVLGGFGAGGTAALLALPSTRLAGLLCTSAYPSSGLPSQAATGEDQLIVVLHGLEDEVVPVEVAREQWRMLGNNGYRAVVFNAMKGLFRLLDIDNEGSIEVEEFIAGCCRIHGPAKAIDLTTLMCQVMLLHRQWWSHAMLLEDFLHFTGFLAGGETPATMSSASPVAKMQGTPRSAKRFSFCLPAEEKALSNDNLTLELPELNDMQASGDLVDSSPRTHHGNRRSAANSSDKNLNGNLPTGVFALLATLAKNRSCSGISRSTQILYCLVFTTRYLDLLDKTQAFYLVFFKITYIVTSIIVLAVFYKLDATYERQKDTCSLAAILVPCSISAILLAETYQPFDILWTFSQFCEGFAMVPQYVFCYRDRLAKDVGVTLYVLSMGAYRCFYAANWIYKKAPKSFGALGRSELFAVLILAPGLRRSPAREADRGAQRCDPGPSAAKQGAVTGRPNLRAQLATANGALSDYVKVRTVGRGSFGEALLVRHRSSGQMSVLKRVRLEGSSDAAAAAESAAREAQVLQKLRHPHIVEFLGTFVDNSRDSTGGTLCLLMAFCEGGDLQNRLQKVRQECRRLSEQPALRWFDELCSAVAYVHQHQVLHRDLKPSNIFLSGRSAGSAHYIHEEESVSIGDFGVSRPLTHSMELVTTMVGTPCYLSPEALASCVETGVGTTHLKIGFATTDTTRSIIQQSPGDRVPMAGREHQRGRRAALCFVAASLGWHSAFSVLSTGEQRFLLVRHGQTTFNAEKRFQGSMDEGSVLTAKGISQAEELGQWLKGNPVAAVFVSPLLRARQTLEVARTVAGEVLPPTETKLSELREIDLYEWQGRTQDEIRAEDPELMRLWKEETWNLQVSGRYVVRDLWRRSIEAWHRMRQVAPSRGETSLVVAHGAIIKALISTALGLPEQGFRHLAMSNGEVVEVAWSGSEAKWRKLHPDKGPWRCLADEEQAMKANRDKDLSNMDAA